MKMPKSFVPDKEYKHDFKELDKKKPRKIRKRELRNIRDLILKIEEIGGGYKHDSVDRLGVEEFMQCFESIDWYDIKDNFYRWYGRDPGEDIEIYILEYHTKELLQKRLEHVYKECCSFEEASGYISEALIVDKYALILCGDIDTGKDLANIKRIYRERFGAKKLVKDKQPRFELK